MDGFLLIDKPSGWTSHDVVARVRSTLKQETGQRIKVGHTGTLDPFATGLLILVVGSYTKKAADFSKLDKTYQAELMLGYVSTTYDIEGKISPKSTQIPSKEAVETTLNTFLGTIQQIPPAHSAIKVAGQRAYKLARAGKTVVMEPRRVTIYEISDIKYDYPKLSLTTSVSSGTYIRSLAADIGVKLGTGAYLSALRRTQVGHYKVTEAIEMSRLTAVEVENNLQK